MATQSMFALGFPSRPMPWCYYDGVEVLKDHLESVAPVDFEELQELTRVVRTNAQYPEYPATYQQVIELWVYGSRGEGVG